MRNEGLESNLLKLFSRSTGKPEEDYLIEKIGESLLTIQEMSEKGKCEVSFKNGHFTQLSEKMLGTNKFIGFFNRQEGDIIRKICDGIFLVLLKNRVILCLVELKRNINNNFERAVKQIEGSYLKAAMLLSLLCDIRDIELAVFIAGHLEKIIDDPDIDYLKREADFMERDNLESKLKEFSHNREVRMNFPFFLEQNIHENYKKKNIRVYHLEHGDTFDMKSF
jgi:hypothetical protein